MPILEIPLKYFVGLPNDQAPLLRQMCRGYSIAITAPGGTGKSAVINRYLEIRSSHFSNDSFAVFGLSVDPSTSLRDHARMWRPPQIDEVIREAQLARASGNTVLLIIEEHTVMTSDLISNLNLFNQVIIVGDTAQGSFDSINGRLRSFLVQSGIQHLSMHLIWRSSNQAQFNLMGSLAYQGRFESYGVGSGRPPDTVRARLSHTPVTMPFTGASIRVLRHLMANTGTTVTYVVSTKEQAVRMLACLVSAAQFKSPRRRFRIVHRSLVQGIQADVVLMDATTFNLTNHDEIEKSLMLTMGRARHRTELLLDSTWHERDHAVFAAALYGMRFETISARADLTTYGRFAKLINDDGRLVLRAGLTHLTLAEKASGKPLVLINMMGRDANETAFRKQLAGAKSWTVITELIETFGTLFIENDPLVLSLLPKQEDGKQPNVKNARSKEEGSV